jgi:regulator of cell morphogenesis and NO signaling
VDSRNSWAGLPVGGIVERDYRAAVVFEHHGIDYCCERQVTLADACQEAAADLAAIEAELTGIRDRVPPILPTTAWDLDQIVAYIVDQHHRYVRDTLPLLLGWCARLVARHGDEHQEFRLVADLVDELDAELTAHLVKEEQILFPWVTRLAVARRDRVPIGASPFGTVLNPIRAMETEHERAEEIVGALRALTGNFLAPQDGCVTWRLCWAELARFDEDLRNHVHLENHLLFPRAIELERLLM